MTPSAYTPDEPNPCHSEDPPSDQQSAAALPPRTSLTTGTNTLDPVQHDLCVAVDLLKRLTAAATLDELVEGVVDFVMEWMGCEAIAVRLKEDCDFPFYVTRGFDDAWVEAENSLCCFDENGWPITDEHGQPVLQCVCGSIIQRRFSTNSDACTAAGSFVTNDVDAFLSSCPGKDLPVDLRGRCVERGYKSIAIIPLRRGSETIGVLHLCDHRRDAFAQPIVAVLEELGENLATLIAQHQALATAQRSERSYRDLIENADALVIRLDPEGNIRFCNRFAEEFFGYRREELVGRPALGTIIPEREGSGRDLAAMMRDILTDPERFRLNENENITRDGRRVWLMWSNRPLYDASGGFRELLSVGTDVSRYRHTEQELLDRQTHLRSLATQLVLGEERERRRLADGLHEDAAQVLAYCKMQAAELLQCSLDPKAQKLASGLDASLLQVMQRLRDVSFELSPSALYRLGLIRAVQVLANHVMGRTELQVSVRERGEELSLSQELQIALYQAVRELLNNAVQHSGAATATITVAASDGTVVVEVTDDGKGFDPSELKTLTAEGQYGLFSLQERIEHLQGRLLISSSPDSGTRVTIQIPLSNH